MPSFAKSLQIPCYLDLLGQKQPAMVPPAQVPNPLATASAAQLFDGPGLPPLYVLFTLLRGGFNPNAITQGRDKQLLLHAAAADGSASWRSMEQILNRNMDKPQRLYMVQLSCSVRVPAKNL